jgi:hypothetical protein
MNYRTPYRAFLDVPPKPEKPQKKEVVKKKKVAYAGCAAKDPPVRGLLSLYSSLLGEYYFPIAQRTQYYATALTPILFQALPHP